MNRPSNPFPLLPLRNGALLPGNVMPLLVGRKRSMALIEDLEAGHSLIGVGSQRDADTGEPGIADLHPIGTWARVLDIQKGRRGYRVVLEGLKRFELKDIVSYEPYWKGEGEPLADVDAGGEAEMLAEALAEELAKFDKDGDGPVANLIKAARQGLEPGELADRIAGVVLSDGRKQIDVLMAVDTAERLRLVTRFVGEAIAENRTRAKIEEEVRRELNENQREAVLRKQLAAIKKELGEGGDQDDEMAKLKLRLDEAGLPEETRKAVDKELRRLESGAQSQAEGGVIRNWLEWIADLPWSTKADENFDLDRMEQQLNDDHHGLEDVKKRILEHMAVLGMLRKERANRLEQADDEEEKQEAKRGLSATILCLAGPPGVGKTSLGRSIAEATGRPFVRIALGGVRDEAEIRGHRRTYVGSRPGRIVSALKKAKANNPVILLDEIDKLARGWSGDPEAALLEVLDPEQNHSFTDHYLEQPFDLSDVLFLTTANDLSQISPPLRDRMEVIELEGYTRDDKVQIARRHLLPRQLDAHGLPAGTLELDDETITRVILDHTREPGVRQLNRMMAKLVRSVALQVARAGDDAPLDVSIGVDDLEEHLGRPKFRDQVAERTSVPGVATGLAWTPVGGDVLFVETSRMPGKGKLEITGQLGDVMKESARAALTYLRANADKLGVDASFLDANDLHIHVPAGAVPKDGPSAGVTIFSALTSLLTGRRVRSDTAMTGEVTLRGRVLPVGGIKAKVLAAHRMGLTRVILPSRNERDIEDLPEDVREALEFILAEDMDQVLAAALEAEVWDGTVTPDEPDVPEEPAAVA